MLRLEKHKGHLVQIERRRNVDVLKSDETSHEYGDKERANRQKQDLAAASLYVFVSLIICE